MRNLSLGLLIFLAVCVTPALAAEPLPRFEPGPCPATLPNRQVNCGFLIVPEDRSQPDSPTIRLAVAVLKASDPASAPDPILFINGGPGAEALSDLPRFVNTFAFLTADPKRDVIIFDQRGVGVSQPALDCHELQPILVQLGLGSSLAKDALPNTYRACRDRWLAQGVNLAAYSTAASAADINDLWHTLGYQQVNLYGVSYGTLVTQTVARDYPDGIRSIVLDSAYPLNIHLLQDSAANLHAALLQVFADCAADWACHLAYPDLPAVYAETVQGLQQQPATLTFSDPATGLAHSASFDDADFVGLLRSTPNTSIPAVIYAVHEGDFTQIAAQLRAGLDTIERYGAPPNRALTYSVMCSQAMYQVTPDEMAGNTYPESNWARSFVYQDLFPIPCSTWPHAAPDPSDSQPWVSPIPTLILQGANDGTLAANYNALLTATFPKGSLITVPNVGHGVLTVNLCANTLARAFFNDPAQTANMACLGQSSFQFNFKYTVRASAAGWPVTMLSGLLAITVVWAGGVALRFARRQPFAFSLRHSWRLMGWALPALAAVLALVGLLGWLRVIGLEPLQALPTIMVPLAALQAAFLFSPDDEPALEVTLATPRPLAWTLWERWGVLIATYGVIGLGLSLVAAVSTGEMVWVTVARWLPPLAVLSALSVALTLILRRALISLSLVSLTWFAAYFLGGYLVQMWPFAWPLHFYSQPGEVYFWLNRLWLVLAGLGLLVYASLRLLNNEERLLLGSRPKGRAGKTEPLEKSWAGIGPLPTRPAALTQILGIIRYELMMQVRRPALAVFAVCLIIIPILNVLIGNAQLAGLSQSVAAGLTPADYAQTLVTNQVLPISWLGGLAATLIVVFIIVADTFPKDRQLGLYESLQSLPVRPATYLIGKVFSVWAGLGLAIMGAGLLTSLINWARFGAFNLGLYWEMWLVGVGSLAFINSALGVLLTATQPNNRRAVLVGVGLAVATLALMVVGFLSIQSAWSHLLPGRPALSLYYLVGYPNAFLGLTTNSGLSQVMGSFTSRPAALLDVAAGFGEVLLVGLWMLTRLRKGTFG